MNTPTYLAIFDRVIHADWVNLVPIIAFVCFAVAFGMIIARASRMPPKDVERISRMPLEDSESKTSSNPRQP